MKVGVIGAELQNTPELVSAGATAGLTFLPEAERIKAESERLRREGVKVQIVLIHQGTASGTNAIGKHAGHAVGRPDRRRSPTTSRRTTVDAMIVGHTHRVSNLMVGDILVTEGINAGATLLGPPADGQGRRRHLGRRRHPRREGHRRHPAARRQGDRRRRQRRDAPSCATRSSGTQTADILRDPTRLHESEMGNMVADAMRAKYPGVEAAFTNSGGLASGLSYRTPPTAGEAPCEITWGEMFAVLPFGNRTVDRDADRAPR